jgi:D-tagatose-1,6-bisphosphate aldolase subunit GatZ/KbaZ
MQTISTKGSDTAVEEMRRIFEENRAGRQRGIYSVCSAHQLVLEAAFAQAARDKSLLLIEATCNQVNQEGGYTGLTPERFCDYVRVLAREAGFPEERLILGGDHLGPNPWRSASSNSAMEKACAMVKAYASAGFAKIHLDASMACADDIGGLTDVEIARRTARLCEAAEAAAAERSFAPIYIIGTEVPPPGGAKGKLEVEVTETSNVQKTLDLHRAAFEGCGLSSVWERVVGVVVQPGVEFGDLSVADYVPERAARLSEWLAGVERIVFEAHSTDYQTGESLEHLVRDHFAILKVGPELTFSLREAIFGLACIEEEWIADSKRSDTRAVLDRVMVDHPENWEAYYHGDSHHLRLARAYSQSDRIRYYWPHPDVSAAVSLLMQNLEANPAPLPLIEQYLPYEAEAICREEIANIPHAILLCHIQRTLARYAHACRS